MPCLVLSCPVLCCLVLSCLVLSCPVLSCPVLSCPVLSCLVLSRLVLSRPILSCLVLAFQAKGVDHQQNQDGGEGDNGDNDTEPPLGVRDGVGGACVCGLLALLFPFLASPLRGQASPPFGVRGLCLGFVLRFWSVGPS